LTSEVEWDPSVLDHDFKEDEQWGEIPEIESSFDNVGDYKHRVIVQHLAYFQHQDGSLFDDNLDQCVFDAQVSEPLQDARDRTKLATRRFPPEPTPSSMKIISKRDPDYNQLCPFFG
jgi:hypothetical protein